MAQSVFNMTKSILNSVLGRRNRPEEDSDDDFLSQTQQNQSREGSLSSESEVNSGIISIVSYTESELALDSVAQTKRRLERLRRMLEVVPEGDEEEVETLREDIQMAEIRHKKAERREAKRLARERRLEHEREMERQRQLELQKQTEKSEQLPVTRISETPFISEEEHQRRMRSLDRTLRGVKPRKPGPPKPGELLDPEDVVDLAAKGYKFGTVRMKETAGIIWEKVVSVEKDNSSDSEGSSQDLTIPLHGEQIDGQVLVKLINANLVPMIGEKVNELGNITIGNYEDTFSTRNKETELLQPLETISGLLGDHVAVMLANGRYRVASMKVLQELFELGGKTMEGIRIISGPISDHELKPEKTSPQEEDQTADNPGTDLGSKPDSQPTVPQPGGEPSATSKIEQHEHGLLSKDKITEKLKPEEKISQQASANFEPPKYKLGVSGLLESVENKTQLQRVGKELKSCKTKVTKLRNRLIAADLNSLPLEEIERNREEFEVKLQELTRVWHEKVSYMGPENGFKEAEIAKSTLQGYQAWLADLRRIETIKRNIILETPKTSRKQQQVLSSEDESEVDDMFHHGNWSAKMRNVERLSKPSGRDPKTRKRKTVEFNSNLKTVFNDGVKGTSTPAPAQTTLGDPNFTGSDPVMQQIEQIKRAFELEKEQLKKETARGFEQMKKEFENEREKIRQELVKTTSPHLDNSSTRTPNPRSNTSRDIDPQMNTVMDVINRQSRGGSLSQAVLAAFKDSPEHQQKHFSRHQETSGRSSHQDTHNRSNESSHRDSQHDSRGTRGSNHPSSRRNPRHDQDFHDTGQSVSRSDPGRPYDKIPTKLNIKKFSGNQDEFSLFKAKFQTLVESKHLPPEEKAVILVDNLEKDPLKLATAVVAGKFKENSLQRIWESLEEHYGGERRRKTMPLQRLRSMNFITKFNRQELLNFHVILTEIRSHYATTDEDKLWEENSEIVSLARERISEARQSEYLSHLRYLHRKDNFISLCNWIKEKLEIHHNVEETSVIRKAGERSYQIFEEEETDGATKEEHSDAEDTEDVTATGQEYRRKPRTFQKKESGDNLHLNTLESLGNKSSQPPAQTPRERPACLFCKKEHPLYSCDAFDKIAHEEKNKFVRANRVCFHCLNPGHIATKCDYFPDRVCNLEGCLGSHHRKLHPPKTSTCYGYEEEYPDEKLGAELNLMNSQTQTEQTNYGANGTFVAIRTVPAILTSGNKKKRVIVALDACSNNTNINESLAEELGLKKLKGGVTRSVGYLERTVKFQSDMVQFNLCPLDGSGSHPVFAWTIKDLVKNTPVVDWKKEVARYPHLRDLKVPDKEDEDRVDILLGTDYAHLMAVTSSCIGKPGEPIAEKTALGLAFSGKLKNCVSKKEDATNFGYNGISVCSDFVTLTNYSNQPEETTVETVEDEIRSPVSESSETFGIPLTDGSLVTSGEASAELERQEKTKEKRPFTILVEGNIGSGKSSFLKLIEESNPEDVEIIPEPVEKWQNCDGVNLLQLMYEDPKKNSFAFQTYVQLTKVQLHKAITEKPYRLMERSLLSARYCFVENLLQNKMITAGEYAVLEKSFQHFTSDPSSEFKVDQIVYLRTDPKVSFQRIAKRNRVEEKKVSFDYIDQLHNLHEDWLINRTQFQPLPAPLKVIDANVDISILKEKFTLNELLLACDSAIEDYIPPLSTHSPILLAPAREILLELVGLTKEEREQDPRNSEQYSTFWDRVLHEAVKDIWEQEKILLEELSPVFSNQLKEVDKSQWTEAQITSDNKLKIVYLPEIGQFQASIPWKTRPRFRNNLRATQNRQKNCLKRLEKSDLEEIRTIFDGYHTKGYIRRVTDEEAKDPEANYLPWFPVIRKDRDTTKIRLVFDAAAKDVRGVSLNSEIELTPNRLQDLFKVILRFRKFQFVVTSDVSEMFLRIRLDPSDTKYHRFVLDDEIWEWLVTLFGNLSSPNASQKVLELCCILFGKDFPEAVESIIHSCFMDDVCDSRETRERAVRLVKDLIALFARAGMVITKFNSNAREALEACDKSLLAKQVTFHDKTLVYELSKVLGMTYSPDESDCFRFSGRFKSLTEWVTQKKINVKNGWTKRQILQATAAIIFDPTGLISPYTVQAKTIMQDIWRTKVGWDDVVEREITVRFVSWIEGVFDLTDLQIPRWTGYSSKSTRLELHIFCDASEAGYCVAVYSRVINDEDVVMTLLTGKSRVSPLKSESISRMELIACLLGVRIWNAVKATYPTTDVHFWTDSMVCLYWISEVAKSFRAFVAHRLGEIQKFTKIEQWHHIPTDQNPADIGTRPITVKELKERTLWWRGPKFLHDTKAEWPKTNIIRGGDKKEEKTTLPCFITLKSIQRAEVSRDAFEKYHPRYFSVSRGINGYVKCIQKCAYILRAVRIFKGGERPLPGRPELTQTEEEDGKKWLIMEAQKEFYFEELSELKGKPEKGSQKIKTEIRKFNPRLDEDGIIRSSSRLSNIDFYPMERRFPIILPRKAEFTRLLVEHLHVRFEHTLGYNALKSEVHAEYAIHGLGKLIDKVNSRCQECRLRRAKLVTQQMAPIPRIRCAEQVHPFYKTGLDFAGPFNIKMGRAKARKPVSVLILTCLQVRAVHFEVTDGQTTKHVLNALSRFADIRGVPDTIISDNQTSFHKADKDLREWMQNINFDELVQKTGMDFKPNSKGIRWIFNPPVSPHFGGIYETIVKAMKRALYATIKNADLDDDEFRTAVSGAMSILNSRPICPTGRHDDLETLTPDHFLKSHLGGAVFPPNTETSMNMRERYRHVDVILNHLWSRFHKEIPVGLVPRKKWSEEQPDLKTGDVVAELDHNTPRRMWRLMRVEEVLPGTDGLIRRVKVINSEGRTYERGVARLLPVVRN